MKNKERPGIIEALVELIFDGDSERFEEITGFSPEYRTDEEVKSELITWLNSEYIEPFKITRDEKCILENIVGVYEIIQRGYEGELFVYDGTSHKWVSFKMFSRLFLFIKFGETYYIDDILKRCEVVEDETL